MWRRRAAARRHDRRPQPGKAMATTIELARPGDLDEIVALLVISQLPPDGLRDHLATTFVARAAGRIVGSAGLERYANGALLRSVAVLPERRGQRHGRELIETVPREVLPGDLSPDDDRRGVLHAVRFRSDRPGGCADDRAGIR